MCVNLCNTGEIMLRVELMHYHFIY